MYLKQNIYLTHHHADHTTGLSQFSDLITIACRKTKDKLKNIDISFEDELIIELGGIQTVRYKRNPYFSY